MDTSIVLGMFGSRRSLDMAVNKLNNADIPVEEMGLISAYQARRAFKEKTSAQRVGKGALTGGVIVGVVSLVLVVLFGQQWLRETALNGTNSPTPLIQAMATPLGALAAISTLIAIVYGIVIGTAYTLWLGNEPNRRLFKDLRQADQRLVVVAPTEQEGPVATLLKEHAEHVATLTPTWEEEDQQVFEDQLKPLD